MGLNQLNEIKVITKVVANMEGDREQLSIGDGDVDNTLFIQNPIITEEILENIYNNILNFTYVPLNVRSWKTFPYLECGDFIEFRQRDGSVLKTIIQTNKVNLLGGLKGRISSPAKSFSQSEYGFDGNTNQIIGSIQSRIGVYVLAENSSATTIDTRFQGKMMLPLTSLSVTDVEVTITMIGEATQDTILHAEIRGGIGVLGKKIRSTLRQGQNTISVNFLLRALPQLSDNLILWCRVDGGKFSIEQNEAQFYVYGANLIGDSGTPYANIEDTLEVMEFVILSDSVFIEFGTPEEISVSGTIEFESYVNEDEGGTVIE